jgi:hypothetical protein
MGTEVELLCKNRPESLENVHLSADNKLSSSKLHQVGGGGGGGRVTMINPPLYGQSSCPYFGAYL